MSNSEEVPAVCERCLGSNPYLKMIKEPQGAQCKLCTRVFTVFKWNAVQGSKFAKTVICLTCARQRNCCQACMLDLTYGVSIQLRDAAFKMAGVENAHGVAYSANNVTKRYNAQKEDQKYLENGGDNQKRLLTAGEDNAASKARQKAEEILRKLVEKQKASQKSRYVPKNPVGTKDIYSNDNLKSVDITKILSKLPFNGNLTVPKDQAITSFFVFGINDEITNIMVTDTIETMLIQHWGAAASAKVKFRSVILNHRAKCGFVDFEKRKHAEDFAQIVTKPRGFKGPGLVVIKNAPVRITWSRVKKLGSNNLEQAKLGSIVRKQMKFLAEKDKTGSKNDTVKSANGNDYQE